MKKTFIVVIVLSFIPIFLFPMEPKSDDSSNALLSSFMMMKYPESSQKAQVANGQPEDHKIDEDKEALKWRALWAIKAQKAPVGDRESEKDTTSTPDVNSDSHEEVHDTVFKRYSRLCNLV